MPVSSHHNEPITKNRKEKFVQRNKAMNLVEILVAVFILSALFMGLFQGLHSGYQGTERLAEESYAANHAISLLEALTLVPYSKLPTIPEGTSDVQVPALLSGISEFRPTSAPDPDYVRLVEVRELSQRTRDESDGNNSQWGALKLIRIEVSWQAKYLKPQKTRTMVFQTLVTDDTEVSR